MKNNSLKRIKSLILFASAGWMMFFSFESTAQIMETYTPTTNSNIFYSAPPLQDLNYINDGDLINNGTIWASPPSPFEMVMHFASPVVLDSVMVKGGQFNGNYNVPQQMNLFRGTSAGTLLLTVNPGYSSSGYDFVNTISDTIYTWVITPAVALTHSSIREISCFSSCSSTSSVTAISACNNYNSPSGNYVWITSGTYLDTIANAGGCDSILTINLTINTINNNVTQNGIILMSDESNAQYQWINCASMIAINGATNQSFVATVNGNYAVVVTENGCTDTSGCMMINTVGESEMNLLSGNFSIYPNPAETKINFALTEKITKIEIISLSGQNMMSEMNTAIHSIDITALESGIYFLKIETEIGIRMARFIKF